MSIFKFFFKVISLHSLVWTIEFRRRRLWYEMYQEKKTTQLCSKIIYRIYRINFSEDLSMWHLLLNIYYVNHNYIGVNAIPFESLVHFRTCQLIPTLFFICILPTNVQHVCMSRTWSIKAVAVSSLRDRLEHNIHGKVLPLRS